MRVLFVVSRLHGARTVFRVAERMAEEGGHVIFLFIQEGCRHAAAPEVVRTLGFAEGIYALREDCMSSGLLDDLVEGVQAVGYSGWVDLLEACERVVSWT